MPIRCEVVGESEIGDFDVHVGVEEKVLGLEIAVNNPVLVTIVDGFNDLPELPASQRLGHPPVASDVLCK